MACVCHLNAKEVETGEFPPATHTLRIHWPGCLVQTPGLVRDPDWGGHPVSTSDLWPLYLYTDIPRYTGSTYTYTHMHTHVRTQKPEHDRAKWKVINHYRCSLRIGVTQELVPVWTSCYKEQVLILWLPVSQCDLSLSFFLNLCLYFFLFKLIN